MTVSLQKDEIVEKVSFNKGDFFEIEPFTVHEMYFPDDCVMAVLYDKPIEVGGEKDIYDSKVR